MTANPSIYEQLQQRIATGDVADAIEQLLAHLWHEKRLDEWFEARLMQARIRLGLPLDETTALDDLPEPERSDMEDVYLEACRKVGLAWLEAGDVRRGWTYMQPVGDRAAVAERLARIDPDEEHLDSLIEVALYGGAAPRLGIDLVLEHYGICNAITICQSTMHAWSTEDQARVAERLVEHLHGELLENVQADLRQRGEAEPGSDLRRIVESHPELLADRNYHVDVSHLASVVRMAEVIEDRTALARAADLCSYGRRLDSLYHYAGEEPFADTYTAYELFFRALLGESVDQAIGYFADKAKQFAPAEHGPVAAEVYVSLLSRLGRYQEALDAAIRFDVRGRRGAGRHVPSLLWLASRSGQFAPMLEACRQRDDLLGFAAALIQQQRGASDEP